MLTGDVVMRFREAAMVDARSQLVDVFQSPLDFGACLFDSMFDNRLVQRHPSVKSFSRGF